MNKFMLYLILFLSFEVYGSERQCVVGLISQVQNAKIVEEKSHFCFNKDKTEFVSYGCQKFECVHIVAPVYLEKFLSEFGAPGAKICRHLGGAPEIIEFHVEGAAYKLDRCLLKNEFINTDLFLWFLKSKGLLL